MDRIPNEDQLKKLVANFNEWEKERPYIPQSLQDRVDFYFTMAYAAIFGIAVDCGYHVTKQRFTQRLIDLDKFTNE